MYSYTEITTFRRCPRKYYYSRVLNLEPVQTGWRIDFGSWMDELLNAHYRGEDWAVKQAELTEQWEAEVLPFTDDEELLEVPGLADAVMLRYLERYPDSEWEVLHVQDSFRINGIGVTPDLVVRDTRTGKIWVVDHKTSSRIPDEWDLMADTQHLLYVAAMRSIYGKDEVAGIIFNYIRSKLPVQPRLNKTIKKELGHPDIYDVRRIDTDYDTLARFAAENGVPPYDALNERLAQLREVDPFFRRLPLLTPQVSCDIALEEARETALNMDVAEGLLEAGYQPFPRTVLGPAAGVASCNACPFKELCQAELFGLDTTSAMMLYKEREPLDREYKEVSTLA